MAKNNTLTRNRKTPAPPSTNGKRRSLLELISERIESGLEALAAGRLRVTLAELARFVRWRRKFLPQKSQPIAVIWVDNLADLQE